MNQALNQLQSELASLFPDAIVTRNYQIIDYYSDDQLANTVITLVFIALKQVDNNAIAQIDCMIIVYVKAIDQTENNEGLAVEQKENAIIETCAQAMTDGRLSRCQYLGGTGSGQQERPSGHCLINCRIKNVNISQENPFDEQTIHVGFNPKTGADHVEDYEDFDHDG